MKGGEETGEWGDGAASWDSLWDVGGCEGVGDQGNQTLGLRKISGVFSPYPSLTSTDFCLCFLRRTEKESLHSPFSMSSHIGLESFFFWRDFFAGKELPLVIVCGGTLKTWLNHHFIVMGTKREEVGRCLFERSQLPPSLGTKISLGPFRLAFVINFLTNG